MKGFGIGDFVTRSGSDIHCIFNHNGSDQHDPDLIDVVCIVEPKSKWTQLGEIEYNLVSRYNPIDDDQIEYAASELRRLTNSGVVNIKES